MKGSPLAVVWLLSLLVASGCHSGKPSPERAAVTGQVTLDGEAIEQGSIGFFPTGSTSGMTSGGAIQNGRYSIPLQSGAVVGSNRVEIHASRKSGRKVPAAMGQPGEWDDERIEAVPPQYNSSSMLERTIASGENTLDFELTTK